jgi:basic membrane protein A and related proteins
MKHTYQLFSSVMIVCLLLLTLTPVRPARAAIGVGLVTDQGGTGDMSFNYMANQGLERAETDFGVDGTLYESSSSSDYPTLLQQCVTDGNVLCFAVGLSMGSAIETAANNNPGTHFAIVDYAPSSYPANLRGLLFAEKQAGYLAGALAGKMTSSNIIGVVGGMQIPAVENFAEGFRNGAQCANANTNVIITYTGTFGDPDLGAATAQAMMTHKADVIFGVGGPTGNGGILYATQHEAWGIGVDADQYLTVFNNGTVDGADKLLSSAMKHVDNAVYDTIHDEVNTAFTSGTVTYDLSNDGVGLAPYHETEGSIPQATKDYLDTVKTNIKNGTTDVDTRCAFQIVGDAGAAGVILHYTDSIVKSVTSASDGWYSLTVSPGWTGNVTPTKTAYTFVPTSKTYNNVVADYGLQNYQARTTTTFRSTGTVDGYVLESTQTSEVGGSCSSTMTFLLLGDSAAKQQYRTILSFSTGALLPDNAVITKVTLKVMKQSILGGGNPITMFQGFMVDVKKGYFGTAFLNIADFETAANKTLGPFLTPASGGWYSFNLITARNYINKLATLSGLTQIRLRFKLGDNGDAVSNNLKLYSGDSGIATRPQLIIEYYVP